MRKPGIPSRFSFGRKECQALSDQKGTKQGWGRVKAGSQGRAQPESLGKKLLQLLVVGALSKPEISRQLGQKKVSGQLNKVIRKLLKDGLIQYTIPEKPNNRLQKYRLTEKADSERK